MQSFIKGSVDSLKEELFSTWESIRNTRWSMGFLFAVFCVLFVIVGNVILLIAINFWIAVFPDEVSQHNSSQIAIQVVALIFLVLFFSIGGAIFTIVYGALPMWHILVDTNRAGHPIYRLFLLFCSGLTNGVSSVLGVYATSHTPEFIQAVLLCCIPFSAQAWTVIFIPIERKRNYLSLFFIGSFVLFIGGVLLSSLSAFLHPSSDAEVASWAWALLYLASSVVFGLWCVVQRLYLDAIVRKDAQVEEQQAENAGEAKNCTAAATQRQQQQQEVREPSNEFVVVQQHREGSEQHDAVVSAAHDTPVKKSSVTGTKVDSSYMEEDPHFSDGEGEDEEEAPMMKREWASQTVDSNAAKMVLLLVGLLFQLFVSFVLFPVDAIPWFGTSSSAEQAWEGFRNSVDFIFASWFNVRYGLLYSLGYAMSFIGCTYLNEHSPTLASVVLQLAGPITSLMIIIVPKWNVYKSSNSVGQQVGGVILLLVAALLYHLWEQQSLRRLVEKAQEGMARRRQQQQAQQAQQNAAQEERDAVEAQ